VWSSDIDRPAGGHQRLGGHLSAEHPLTVLIGTDPPEDVDFDGLEVEEVDEKIEGTAHASILSGGGAAFR
jgi:hypothetical protein